MARDAALSARRRVLRGAGAAGLGWGLALAARPAAAQFSAAPLSSPLDASLQRAVDAWVAGAPVRAGRVALDISPLVENGNAVPVTVRVASPMTDADHVREIALFNERNPQRDVVRCELTTAAGRAEVSLRIRLATSQRLVALARMSDGDVWQHTVDVVVTLAACIES